MANNGTITVELKLALASLQSQVKQAASILNFKGAGQAAETGKATAAQEKQTRAVKQTNEALKQQAQLVKAAALASAQADVDRFRAAREQAMRMGRAPAWMGAEQAQKFTDPEEAAARSAEAERLRNLRRLGKQSNTGAGLATDPNAAINPPTTGTSATTPSAGGSKLLGIGQMLASYYLITRAINFALVPLRKFANEMERAASAAAKTYASAMGSGMGLSMTIRRSSLAQIIGVSENDIFQFGAAIKYIQPQIAGAQKILRETNGPLTQLSWQFKILETNIGAMWAKLSVEFAPAVNEFATNMGILVKLITDNAGLIADAAKRIAKSNPLYWFHKLTQFEANTWLGVNQSQVDKGFAHGTMPKPQAWMKQMPASTWEHMGLQVGGGGGTDYNRQTAMNTKETNSHLKELIKAQFQQLNDITTPQGAGGTA